MTHPALQEAERLDLFEEILDNGTGLRVRVTGRSMAPFLKGGEVLTIRKTTECDLRIGDLVFFRDSSGSRMLHRLVRKKKYGDGSSVLQTKGDGLFSCDQPFGEDALLGKVTRIEKAADGTTSEVIDMETSVQQMINLLTAMAHLMMSQWYDVRGRASRFIRSLTGN